VLSYSRAMLSPSKLNVCQLESKSCWAGMSVIKLALLAMMNISFGSMVVRVSWVMLWRVSFSINFSLLRKSGLWVLFQTSIHSKLLSGALLISVI